MSGEHGDGLARSHFNAKLFGPALYDAFRQVKRAFDPKNLMNPGKIVDAPAMTESLKISPQYKPWEPAHDARLRRAGRFRARRSECAAAWASAAKSSTAPCARRIWARSTKSTPRAGAPTRSATRSPEECRKEEFTGKRLYDVMDLCLECKACKAECPSNVDMAKLKYEFLDHYHRANGLPLRNRIFGRIETLNRIGSTLAPVSNWLANSGINRWLMEVFAGIDRRRPLPQFAGETFEDWFRKHKTEGDGAERRGRVVS